MRVLLAGASGVIGTVLIPALVEAGHEVTGLTRTPKGAAHITGLGGEPLIADVLDRAGLLRAVAGLASDAVVSELTSINKAPMKHKDMHPTNRLRVEGTENMMAVAKAVGAKRFLTQSMIFGYGYGDLGPTPLTEDAPFGPIGRKHYDAHGEAMLRNEQIAFSEPAVDGIALRYGLFYGGPATTTYTDMLKARKLPVIHGGPTSFIHLADAVSATVAALELGRGGEAYNVVDDTPVDFGTMVAGVAAEFRTPKPMTLPAWAVRPMPYLYSVVSGRYLFSNAKAKAELGWTPRYPSYREGAHADAVAAGVVGAAEAPGAPGAPGAAA